MRITRVAILILLGVYISFFFFGLEIIGTNDAYGYLVIHIPSFLVIVYAIRRYENSQSYGNIVFLFIVSAVVLFFGMAYIGTLVAKIEEIPISEEERTPEEDIEHTILVSNSYRILQLTSSALAFIGSIIA